MTDDADDTHGDRAATLTLPGGGAVTVEFSPPEGGSLARLRVEGPAGTYAESWDPWDDGEGTRYVSMRRAMRKAGVGNRDHARAYASAAMNALRMNYAMGRGLR